MEAKKKDEKKLFGESPQSQKKSKSIKKLNRKLFIDDTECRDEIDAALDNEIKSSKKSKNT